ncbi:MAG: hypothetical protein WB930_11065 [Syntrophobacteraceae bacterium]
MTGASYVRGVVYGGDGGEFRERPGEVDGGDDTSPTALPDRRLQTQPETCKG